MQEDKKESKKKRIIKGILFFIAPIIIYILLEEMNLLGDITRFFIAIGIFISVGYGIFLIFTDPDEFENSTIIVAGHVIEKEDIRNLKNMSLWEKIKTLHIIDIFLLVIFFFLFMISIILIIVDPLDFFDRFSNPARIQLILIFIIIFVVNGVYIYRRKDMYLKWQRILFWIICIGLFAFFMCKTTPRKLDTREYNYDTFSEIISNYGYVVTETHEIDKLDLKNCKALLAAKNDIMIYFIEKDKNDTEGIKKTFDSFDNYNYDNNCPEDKHYATASNNDYKDFRCEDPDYIVFTYINRNTMVYVKTSNVKKREVKELLERIKYIS